MARIELMSWRGHPAYDWRKSFRKMPYKVTCKELGLAESNWTREDSRRLANDWWRARQAEIESVPTGPHGPRVSQLQERLKLAEQSGMRDECDSLKELIAHTASIAEPPQMDGRTVMNQPFESRSQELITKLHAMGIILDEKQIQSLGHSLEYRRWRDIRARIDFVPQTRNCEHWAEEFLKICAAKNKVSTYIEIRSRVYEFRDWFGSARAVTDISETTVREYFFHVSSLGKAPTSHRSRFVYFKTFVDFLCEEAGVKRPANLHSRKYSFRIEEKEVEPVNLAEVRRTLSTVRRLRPELEVFALLALNCSMQNRDMGSLKKPQIRDGVLTRKRVKTAARKNVPTVSYVLWPETRLALERTQSEIGDNVFLNRNGKPYVSESLTTGDDGRIKGSVKDQIGQLWNRANKDNLLLLSELRRVGADLLDNHPEFCAVSELFMGHASRRLIEKHYASKRQSLLNRAVNWLHDEIFGHTDTVPRSDMQSFVGRIAGDD